MHEKYWSVISTDRFGPEILTLLVVLGKMVLQYAVAKQTPEFFFSFFILEHKCAFQIHAFTHIIFLESIAFLSQLRQFNYKEIKTTWIVGCSGTVLFDPFLRIVLVEPKALCYRVYVYVRSRGFSRILSPTIRDGFWAMFVWFSYPEKTCRRRWQLSFCYDTSMCSHWAFVQQRW